MFCLPLDEAGALKSHGNEALPLLPSLWTDSGFDVVQFTSSHLSFFERFSGDYKTLNIKPSSKLTNKKENHLLMGLIVKRVNGRDETRLKMG